MIFLFFSSKSNLEHIVSSCIYACFYMVILMKIYYIKSTKKCQPLQLQLFVSFFSVNRQQQFLQRHIMLHCLPLLKFHLPYLRLDYFTFNPLSAKFIKWSNTLKQIVGKLPTICLSVFDHFSGLALKALKGLR